MCKKRKATSEEIAREKTNYVGNDFDTRHATALVEGHKDETCESCGTTFMAFIHFVRCSSADCPMKSPGGESVLETLFGLDK